MRGNFYAHQIAEITMAGAFTYAGLKNSSFSFWFHLRQGASIPIAIPIMAVSDYNSKSCHSSLSTPMLLKS
ncbi:hypothetical protein NOC27_286 [Nitrosococcus oceani AFC27]|nr:hypothetical protein NOC27_286 [Nitrosococcus oceani AFC27]